MRDSADIEIDDTRALTRLIDRTGPAVLETLDCAALALRLLKFPDDPQVLDRTEGLSKADALIDYLNRAEQHSGEICPSRGQALMGETQAFWLFQLVHDGAALGYLAVARDGKQVLPDPQTLDPVLALMAAVVSEWLTVRELQLHLAEAADRADKLAHVGRTDHLTGLRNKADFQSECLARLTNDRRPAAMLAFDLDQFKHVNDVYGHQFGDRYLEAVAGALTEGFHQNSIIGRIGGDEFCALIDIPEASRSFLRSVIRNLRHAVQRRMAVLGKPDLGGLSIGVSLYPNQATSYGDLFEKADCALYASKRGTGGGTTVYSNDLEGLMEPADLRDGRDGFRVERITPQFQPICEGANAQTVGLELLSRWCDRDGTLRRPESFAWIFRDHRYASRVTFHVLETALEQLCIVEGWSPQDLPNLWINVTDGVFLNSEFVFDLQSILERYGVPWQKVVLEVNEDSIIGPRHRLVRTSLGEVRRRGGAIALDDFGAGKTGLMQACYWPVDYIKLDRSLVQKLGHDDRAALIVEAVVMVAGRLGQTVVAEGVETALQHQTALSLGCTLSQGYLFAKPMGALNLSQHLQHVD